MTKQKKTNELNVEPFETNLEQVSSDLNSDEVFDSALTEEIVNHKESFFSKTKTIVALLIAGGFLVGLLIFVISQFDLQANDNPNIRTVPPASQTEPLTTEQITRNQTLAANTNSETVTIIGEQLAIQYGADIYKTVTLASATDNVDENNSPAFVALSTYANIPTDFNINNSAQFFIEQLRDVPGDWVYVEETSPPVGVESLYALKLYDQSNNPVNPAIIEIIYFVETPPTEDMIPTLTITITSTVY